MSRLAPFWKAIAPAALGAAGSVANALIAGSFNTASFESVLGGLLAAVVVYFAPNKPAGPPARPPAMAAHLVPDKTIKTSADAPLDAPEIMGGEHSPQAGG